MGIVAVKEKVLFLEGEDIKLGSLMLVDPLIAKHCIQVYK